MPVQVNLIVIFILMWEIKCMENLIIGDTWEMEYLITDRNGSNMDLSVYSIRAAIKDGRGIIIKIANKYVTGGSDLQIIGDTSGKANLIFPAVKTSLLNPGQCLLEIEITTTDGYKYTVVQDSYVIKSSLIDWDSVS